MKNRAFACGVLVMTAASAAPAGALVTPDEMARRDAWLNMGLKGVTAFTLDIGERSRVRFGPTGPLGGQVGNPDFTTAVERETQHSLRRW